MSFLSDRKPPGAPDIQIQVGEEKPHNFYFNHGSVTHANGNITHGNGVQLPSQSRLANLFDIGIFRDTLGPTFALHSSLSLIAWGIGQSVDRVDAKDWLWPGGQVLNVWWAAVGRRVIIDGVPISRTLSFLSWPERLLLAGVTAWGVRMFYRVASRSIERGSDDARYKTADRKQEGYWMNALLTKFLPEAAFQTIISLPFTAPFRHQGHVFTGYHPLLQMTAVGLFSAGFALEAIADYQLDEHKKSGQQTVLREGVWSIVRHPNYLGDAMIHAAFPLLLYGSDMLALIELLGPIANYVFLRYVGGDKENEASQMERYATETGAKSAQFDQYRKEKNSFWPNLQEFSTQWSWVVLGCGAVGVALEQTLRSLH